MDIRLCRVFRGSIINYIMFPASVSEEALEEIMIKIKQMVWHKVH